MDYTYFFHRELSYSVISEVLDQMTFALSIRRLTGGRLPCLQRSQPSTIAVTEKHVQLLTVILPILRYRRRVADAIEQQRNALNYG